MKTRRAFSLMELAVGILIMMITAAAVILSSSSAKQTAEHEAERLAAYLYRTIQKADRLQLDFTLDTEFITDSAGEKVYRLSIRWGNDNYDKFRASAGCKYTDNFRGNALGELVYNAQDRKFNTGGTITVTDSEGANHYVIIATTEGRIRLSATPPGTDSD